MMTWFPKPGKYLASSMGRRRRTLMSSLRDLETLLHSTIATASDLSIFQSAKHGKRAVPAIAYYDPLPTPYETHLQQELRARFRDASFGTLFQTGKELTAALGPWCGDNFWSFAFSERETKKKETRLMRRSQRAASSKQTQEGDQQIALLQEAHEYVSTYNFESPFLDRKHMSSKVMMLFEVLNVHFGRETDQKCLVFVEQRATARLLNKLATHLGGKFLKSSMLTGTSTASVDSMRYSHREQVVTMMKFRKGELNCLVSRIFLKDITHESNICLEFATSVAEEGIDVPECNLVIR